MSSKKPDVWMPLFISDYIVDTTHLNTEQHGAYLLLLMAAWMRGGELPNDDAMLMQICRLDKAKWKKIKPIVAAFFDVSDELWVQERLREEYLHAVKVNNAQVENGKKGGRPPKIAKPIETEDETQEKPTGFDSGKANEKPFETPSHTPSPVKTYVMDTDTEQSNAGAVRSITPGLAVKAMREAGIIDGNPSHPTLIALVAAGAEIAEFQHAAKVACDKKKPNFNYALGIVKNMRDEAASLNLKTGPLQQGGIEARNQQATQDWVPPELRSAEDWVAAARTGGTAT
jgi:uncharacterized protein YdaU (DUF1376 family)